MKLLHRIALLSVISILALSVACDKADPPTGVKITVLSSSLGMVEGNPNQQRLSYSMSIVNNTEDDVYITNVTPELSDSTIILPDDADNFIVNQTLTPNSYINVNGEIILGTNSMTKEEIAASSTITGVNIESSVVIKVPLR